MSGACHSRSALAFVACCLLGLAGCATTRTLDSSAAGTLPELAAPSSASPRVALQLVRAAYGDESLSVQCAVSLTREKLTVVGLGPVGQRLFTLEWDGHESTLERAPMVPRAFDAARLLADLQLVLWPLDQLEPLWARSGYRISEPFPGVRRVHRGSRLVAEVHYAGSDPWDGRTWLANFEHDYALTIDSRAEEP